MKIDKLDKQILEYLVKDARKPFTEIAKDLLVSPGTIHVRVKKMERCSDRVCHDLLYLYYDVTLQVNLLLRIGAVDILLEALIREFVSCLIFTVVLGVLLHSIVNKMNILVLQVVHRVFL